MEDYSKLYFSIPYGRMYHIFNEEDNKSLCGKAAMLFIDKNQIEKVTGDETYRQGQDCKQCFRKAGLKT